MPWTKSIPPTSLRGSEEDKLQGGGDGVTGSGEHVKALVRSHASGDDDAFYSVALGTELLNYLTYPRMRG